MKNLKQVVLSHDKTERMQSSKGTKMCPDPEKKGKHTSKKHDLKKLATGWNDAIFEIQKLSSDPVILETRGGPLVAIVALQASGMRPDELETGIIFHLNDGEVTIEVQGSKVIKDGYGKPTRGIEFRSITVNPKFCQASRFLVEYLTQRSIKLNKTSFCFGYTKNTLRNLMADLSEKYNKLHRKNKKKISITGYFFRHHLAASLKACKELTPAQRAQVMGHLSTSSIQTYASAYRSKNPIKPFLKVSTSEQPKQYTASNFLATKQPKPAPERHQQTTSKQATLKSKSPSL